MVNGAARDAGVEPGRVGAIDRRVRRVAIGEHPGDARSHRPGVAGVEPDVRFDSGIVIVVVGCVVVTRKNARLVGEILALFASLGVSRISFSRFSPAGYAVQHAADLLPSRSDVLAALALFALARRPLARAPAWLTRVPAYVLGSLATLWCFECVSAFWT